MSILGVKIQSHTHSFSVRFCFAFFWFCFCSSFLFFFFFSNFSFVYLFNKVFIILTYKKAHIEVFCLKEFLHIHHFLRKSNHLYYLHLIRRYKWNTTNINGLEGIYSINLLVIKQFKLKSAIYHVTYQFTMLSLSKWIPYMNHLIYATKNTS